MFWRRALVISASAVLVSLPALAQQPQAAGAPPPDSAQQQPAPADSQSQDKPPSGIKKVLRRAAPNCVQVAGRQDCWSESQQQKESEEKTKQEAGQQQQPPVPQSQPMPRSDTGGVSSSRDTKIGAPPPSSSVAGAAPDDVQELRPYNPHRADKDVEVGDFYFKRHNYIAAESRYASALKWMPNDAIASYRLAEAQEKLGKISEARKNYQDYLRILPHGEFADEAQKALVRLNLQLESQGTTPTSPPGQTRPY